MNCCNNIRNEKAMIMKNIYELGFALVETMLYLDTHPDDAAAIEYYAEIKDKYVQFMKKYSDYYGPLSMEYMVNDNYWMWVATPMPREVCDMWNYEKRLQYPINIKNCNPTLAAMIISQYGGPDGELGASMRYLSQRYSMPYREVAGLLTDIGTEELGHLEMVSTMVHQLTRNLTMEQIKGTPFEAYYVDHTVGVWPQAAGGVPFCAIEFQSKGDAITDIAEDMAAEQKARSTYDNLLRLCRDDPDVYEPLKFLREREVVHFQRFGEAMSIIQSKLDSKNFYAYNPEFKK